jgi:hypothetical protein
VHEHWNNVQDKQYSRNLGTGSGIELKQVTGKLVSAPKLVKNISVSMSSFPNPFKNELTVSFYLKEAGEVVFEIYSSNGSLINQIKCVFPTSGKQEIRLAANDYNLKPGFYIISLSGEFGNNYFRETQKIQMMK